MIQPKDNFLCSSKATITRCDLSATILFKFVDSYLIALNYKRIGAINRTCNCNLRDLWFGNHIINYKQLNDVNRSNLYTYSYDRTRPQQGENFFRDLPPTDVVLIAPVSFFMKSSSVVCISPLL